MKVYHYKSVKQKKKERRGLFKKIACAASPHLACDKIFLSGLCTVLSALIRSMKTIATAAP